MSSKEKKKTLGDMLYEARDWTLGKIITFLQRLSLVTAFFVFISGILYAFFHLPTWLVNMNTFVEMAALLLLTMTVVAMGCFAYLCWVEYYDSKISNWYKSKIKEFNGHKGHKANTG